MALVPPLVAGVVAEVPCPAGGYLFVLARAYQHWHHRLKVSQVTHRAKDTVHMLIPQSAELWHRYHVLPVTKRPPASRLEAIPAPGITVAPRFIFYLVISVSISCEHLTPLKTCAALCPHGIVLPKPICCKLAGNNLWHEKRGKLGSGRQMQDRGYHADSTLNDKTH